MRPINPVNNSGSIQLKFSVNKHRYSFNPIPGAQFSNKRDLASVRAIAVRIQNDILAECFDSSLEKYRLSPSLTTSISKRLSANAVEASPSLSKAITTIELWDRWVESLQLSQRTRAGDYRCLRSHLQRIQPSLTDNSWLLKLELASSSFNRYLRFLRNCYQWGIEQSYLTANIYEAIKPRKGKQSNIKPFSSEEIQAIIAGFDELYPHYSPFIRFLFSTGVRTSEAIGLQWKDIDLVRKTVTIAESLPIDKTGNGYQKVRKSTKTGSVRELSLNASLLQIFNELTMKLEANAAKQLKPESLVFVSATGCIIDINNFRERYWKPVLAAKDIPYRYPYTARHTLISHCIEAGMPLTQAAYIAGHTNISTVMKHYSKLLNKPELPVIFPC